MMSIACGRTEQYEMAQRVDMGPYTFEVAGAKTGFALFGTRTATIELLFRLYRDDTAPFTTDFTESFTNRMQLVDAAGNAFVVFPVPNTDDFHVGGRGELTPVEGYWRTSPEIHRGGRVRADTYRASINLSSSYMTGMGEIRYRENVGNTISDFKLIIDNPDRRGDQPGQVVIQLH
jgi:hypothetical protein